MRETRKISTLCLIPKSDVSTENKILAKIYTKTLNELPLEKNVYVSLKNDNV